MQMTFLTLKKNVFFEIFPEILLDLQRDIDRKIKFFSFFKIQKIDVPDVYRLKIVYFQTKSINKALRVITLICTHVAHVIYAQFWI